MQFSFITKSRSRHRTDVLLQFQPTSHKHAQLSRITWVWRPRTLSGPRSPMTSVCPLICGSQTANSAVSTLSVVHTLHIYLFDPFGCCIFYLHTKRKEAAEKLLVSPVQFTSEVSTPEQPGAPCRHIAHEAAAVQHAHIQHTPHGLYAQVFISALRENVSGIFLMSDHSYCLFNYIDERRAKCLISDDHKSVLVLLISV